MADNADCAWGDQTPEAPYPALRAVLANGWLASRNLKPPETGLSQFTGSDVVGHSVIDSGTRADQKAKRQCAPH